MAPPPQWFPPLTAAPPHTMAPPPHSVFCYLNHLCPVVCLASSLFLCLTYFLHSSLINFACPWPCQACFSFKAPLFPLPGTLCLLRIMRSLLFFFRTTKCHLLCEPTLHVLLFFITLSPSILCHLLTRVKFYFPPPLMECRFHEGKQWCLF